MNIIFMGTPDFAAASLEKILSSKHRVIAVVTAPDKPRGRGQIISPSFIKQIANKNRIPVLQPDNLRDEGFANQLEKYQSDLFAVVAFRILPKEIFSIPHYGTVNLHASLLPKYRGAAPIQWAIINGEKETGVTTFFIDENIDTGTILLQRSVSIPAAADAGELYSILKLLGPEVLVETIDQIELGKAIKKTQTGEPSFAPKLTKELCRINWKLPGFRIVNLIRGLSPVPGAFTTYQGRHIKIYSASLITESANSEPGKIEKSDPMNGLVIGTGRGSVRILKIQSEGKKAMATEEFLRGFSMGPGTLLI